MTRIGKQPLPYRILAFVFGFWVLAAICLQTWGVFSRNILHMSTAWVDDLQRLNFIWLIWIMAGLSYAGGGLISLDLIQAKLAGKPRAYHLMTLGQTIVELLWAAGFSYLAFQMISQQAKTWEVTTVLQVPLAVLNFGFLVGCILMFLFAIRKLWRAVLDVKMRTPLSEEDAIPVDLDEGLAFEPEERER